MERQQSPGIPMYFFTTVSAALRSQQVSLTADNIMELVSTCMVVLEAPFPKTGKTGKKVLFWAVNPRDRSLPTVLLLLLTVGACDARLVTRRIG